MPELTLLKCGRVLCRDWVGALHNSAVIPVFDDLRHRKECGAVGVKCRRRPYSCLDFSYLLAA